MRPEPNDNQHAQRLHELHGHDDTFREDASMQCTSSNSKRTGCCKASPLSCSPMAWEKSGVTRTLTGHREHRAKSGSAIDESLPGRCGWASNLSSLTSGVPSRANPRCARTDSRLIAVAGDNPERLRKEAAIAALCGAIPLQAASAKRQAIV
jgi:hypothetical protein